MSENNCISAHAFQKHNKPCADIVCQPCQEKKGSVCCVCSRDVVGSFSIEPLQLDDVLGILTAWESNEVYKLELTRKYSDSDHCDDIDTSNTSDEDIVPSLPSVSDVSAVTTDELRTGEIVMSADNSDCAEANNAEISDDVPAAASTGAVAVLAAMADEISAQPKKGSIRLLRVYSFSVHEYRLPILFICFGENMM